MTTKIVYLQGPVKWAKVFEGNRNKGTEKYPVAEGGQYEISFGLTAKDLKEVKSWNRLYEGKVYDKLHKDYLPGDSKLTYVTFKRKHAHPKNDGTIIHEWSGAPDIRADDNTPWGKALIGNGSVCTMKLDVTSKAGRTFVRLEGLRVDEHVEFEGAEEDNEPPTEENRTDGIPF